MSSASQRVGGLKVSGRSFTLWPAGARAAGVPSAAAAGFVGAAAADRAGHRQEHPPRHLLHGPHAHSQYPAGIS